MGGALIIDVPNIPASPSISSPTKIGFKENHAQEVAFAYTDYDSYRAPAGIKLVSTENEPWFEAPWILVRKLNMSRVATEYSAGTGAVINYFGTDTIMDNQSSSVTGTMKIRLPVSWTNTMGVYKIMLYEYNGRGSSEITVSFYNYSSSQSYYNYSYQLNGAFEGAVRVAYDGSGCCILLGDTSYNWNYIKVYVYQVFNGQNVPSNYVNQPYNISIITSEAGLSKITSIPKTSMNKHDTNYIRALNKNGYYGMAIVGNSDNVYIRAPRLGIIPYSSGNPGEGMLGTAGWQFSHIYVNQTKTQRVSSMSNDLRIGSSDNAGWVYCQDICSANGAAEAYWSIRTNGAAVFTNLTSKNTITGNSVVASGEVTAYSDARLKSNIHTLDYRGRLIPRHYVKDGKQSIGFIAQEVQTLYPELVLGYDKSRPYLSLNYNGCTAVLSAQLNYVEDEVTMLKNKVRELEIKVSVLTEQLHSQAI